MPADNPGRKAPSDPTHPRRRRCDPGMVLNRPAPGQYDIRIGVFEGGPGIPSRLGIPELPPRR